MSLSLEEVRKVAHLARIKLAPDEEKKFADQLSAILDYVAQLNELEVTDVEPTTRAIDVSNVMRDDRLESYEHRDSILENAPDRDEEFFKVPKILSE